MWASLQTFSEPLESQSKSIQSLVRGIPQQLLLDKYDNNSKTPAAGNSREDPSVLYEWESAAFSEADQANTTRACTGCVR